MVARPLYARMNGVGTGAGPGCVMMSPPALAVAINDAISAISDCALESDHPGPGWLGGGTGTPTRGVMPARMLGPTAKMPGGGTAAMAVSAGQMLAAVADTTPQKAKRPAVKATDPIPGTADNESITTCMATSAGA